MNRVIVFASVCSLTVGGLLGCGAGSGSPTTRSVTPTEKRHDVQVELPGAKVKVRSEDDGRVKLDVQTKGTGR
ncbi:hypothetical protein [Urbifossiella limnaea]|uniref:Uncharacterized protein n=1 Tax=Urbifossiella limnaea TaxID=2528023 RepID=A0A517XRK3_9BACT|nr:hypothetical protein [Urbifossiella limnaea]QDU20141.1 hypothetical protein ETAA1_20850 [Urbifossiella limnaea]